MIKYYRANHSEFPTGGTIGQNGGWFVDEGGLKRFDKVSITKNGVECEGVLAFQGVTFHSEKEFFNYTDEKEFDDYLDKTDLGIVSPPLTKKDRTKVALMVKRGIYTNSEIATKLSLSVDNVKQHKRWLEQKGYLP